MKYMIYAFAMLVLCMMAFPQEQTQAITEDLGMNTFSNDQGEIIVVVDAGLAVRNLDSPYIMFMAYMAAKKENKNIVISRDNVTMVYNGTEYKMPSVKELIKNYDGQIHDFDLYRELGKEGLIFSKMRFYRFPKDNDFFPAPGMRERLAADEGSLYGIYGLKTKFYFKNPGFKKGDSLLIKVRDKKNAEVTGEVAVEFK